MAPKKALLTAPITECEVAALFQQAKPAEMPSPRAITEATESMNWARQMHATQSSAKGWETPWSRAAKDARSLRGAVALFLERGGEVEDKDDGGRVVARLRPGGVWKGDAVDRLNGLLAALDSSIPILDKHMNAGGPRQPQAKPETASLLRLWDIYKTAVTGGYPVVHRDLYNPARDSDKVRPFPGRSKDGPAVRFILAALPVIGAPRMDASAVSKALNNPKLVEPPPKIRI